MNSAGAFAFCNRWRNRCESCFCSPHHQGECRRLSGGIRKHGITNAFLDSHGIRPEVEHRGAAIYLVTTGAGDGARIANISA